MGNATRSVWLIGALWWSIACGGKATDHCIHDCPSDGSLSADPGEAPSVSTDDDLPTVDDGEGGSHSNPTGTGGTPGGPPGSLAEADALLLSQLTEEGHGDWLTEDDLDEITEGACSAFSYECELLPLHVEILIERGAGVARPNHLTPTERYIDAIRNEMIAAIEELNYFVSVGLSYHPPWHLGFVPRRLLRWSVRAWRNIGKRFWPVFNPSRPQVIQLFPLQRRIGKQLRDSPIELLSLSW